VLVLSGLRLVGVAEPAVLAGRTNVARAELDDVLARAAAAGWARHRDGRLAGWSLTVAGRAEAGRLLAAELDGTGLRPAVAGAYGRFLAVNDDLLATCTDWQVRDQATSRLNDHTDAVYDRGVVERLRAIDAIAQPICADLAAMLHRFEGYGARLAGALGRVAAGGTDWFTRPGIDSYHTVWFELHEDLLATLGIERAKEATA